MSSELWKPVPCELFASHYEVSNQGRVRSLDRVVTENRTGKCRRHLGRLLTPKRTGKYFGIDFFVAPHKCRFYIHRLVASAFIPNPHNKPHVNHKNRNRSDNSASNLEWVTAAENTAHLLQTGWRASNHPRGADHYQARVSEADVIALRETWSPGDSIHELRKTYGVSSRALYQILRGATWKHVTPARAIRWPG
jgi:hypothetical protein